VIPATVGRVYAPSVVVKELSHPRSPEAVRISASSPPEWLTVQDPMHTDPSLKLGAGEAAAISLALELEADHVLIDGAQLDWQRRGRPCIVPSYAQEQREWLRRAGLSGGRMRRVPASGTTDAPGARSWPASEVSRSSEAPASAATTWAREPPPLWPRPSRCRSSAA